MMSSTVRLKWVLNGMAVCANEFLVAYSHVKVFTLSQQSLTRRCMSTYTSRDIRNIGIMAHINAGKTTLAESLLYTSKRIASMGSINDGTTQLDYMEQEIKRGITIRAACTSFDWNGYHINLVDTPGHTDFSGEVYKAMDVVDCCIIVIDGTKGVQAQTRQINSLLPKNMPRLFFINKIDRAGVSLSENMESIRKYIAQNSLLLNGADNENLKTGAELTNPLLIESLANYDDELADCYLSGENVTSDQVLNSLKHLVNDLKVIPVLCGSAVKIIGIEDLLNFICQVFPSPNETKCQNDSKTTLYTFKTIASNINDLNIFCKILGGSVKPGAKLYNLTIKKQEKCLKLYKIHGNSFTECQELISGDIGMIRGFKSTRTGHLLSSSSATVISQQFQSGLLETNAETNCVCFATISAKNRDQHDALLAAMATIKAEDPSLFYKYEPDVDDSLTIGGYGELHFEILAEILRDQHGIFAHYVNMIVCPGIPVNIGAARVALKECPARDIAASINLDENAVRDGSSIGLELEMEPLELGTVDDAESSFNVMATSANVAYRCIVEVDSGEIRGNCKRLEEIKHEIKQLLHNTMASGPLLQCPLISTKVTVKRLLVYSNSTVANAKATAAKLMRNIYDSRSFRVLEPIMSLDIKVPNEYVGAVVKDLQMSRQCSGINTCSDDYVDEVVINAMAPMRMILGYSKVLKSITNGGFLYRLDDVPGNCLVRAVPCTYSEVHSMDC